MGNKSAERKCLDIVLKDSPKDVLSKQILKVLDTEIVDGESPDFIIGNTGVEHFLVDMFFTTKKRKAMSLERINSGEIEKAM